MPGDLQDILDLNKVGDTPITVSGRLELGQLSRLRALARPGGRADVQLQATTVRGRRLLSGYIRADVPLTCQRCLGAMTYPVAAKVHLMWAGAGSEAVHVSDGYDAIVSASGRVSVANLVEDELLLALPMVARHALPEQCTPGLPVDSARHAAAPGPFAVLEALKRH